MRMIFAACIALSLTSTCLAGAIDRPSAPGTDAEAKNYAAQLARVLTTISNQYVRPVPNVDLARAAMEGLYEAARLPVPTSLGDELQVIAEQDAWLESAEELVSTWFEQLPPTGQRAAFQGLEALKAARDLRMLEVFTRCRSRLGDVEELRGHGALFASIRGAVRVLDAYSGLVDGREWTRGSADDSAPGLGIEIADNHGVGPLIIKAVTPGGPGQRAGLRPGDRITHVHGKPVNGKLNPFRLVSTVKGGPPPVPPPPVKPPAGAAVPVVPGLPPGYAGPAGPVVLTVVRSDNEPARKVRLEPQAFKGETVLGTARRDDNSWDYWADRKHKIAHVRIASLAAGTSEDLMQVLCELQQQEMRGLILDLRWCPGGFLNEAVNVALVFVGPRRVATVKGRDGNQIEYSQTSGLAGRPKYDEKKIAALPLIVLVNGSTSGGAELIAAAVQDNQRGGIAGQRTLGKASVQTPIDLVDDTKLKLTTGTFIRPSGKNLHRFPDSKSADDWGVRPDERLEFRVSADLDKQLRAWWQLQTLRPGSSRDALPLDDPTADPQRQAAIDALIRLARKKAAQTSSAN